MRIEPGRTGRLIPFVGLSGAAVLLLLIVVAQRLPSIGAGQAEGLTPDDRLRLASALVEISDSTANVADTISEADALASARAQYDWSQMGDDARASASLHVATDLGTERAADPIVDRLVWIVHLQGVEQSVTGPAGMEGVDRVLRHAYIFIDARSGEFLSTTWTE